MVWYCTHRVNVAEIVALMSPFCNVNIFHVYLHPICDELNSTNTHTLTYSHTHILMEKNRAPIFLSVEKKQNWTGCAAYQDHFIISSVQRHRHLFVLNHHFSLFWLCCSSNNNSRSCHFCCHWCPELLPLWACCLTAVIDQQFIKQMVFCHFVASRGIETTISATRYANVNSEFVCAPCILISSNWIFCWYISIQFLLHDDVFNEMTSLQANTVMPSTSRARWCASVPFFTESRKCTIEFSPVKFVSTVRTTRRERKGWKGAEDLLEIRYKTMMNKIKQNKNWWW